MINLCTQKLSLSLLVTTAWTLWESTCGPLFKILAAVGKKNFVFPHLISIPKSALLCAAAAGMYLGDERELDGSYKHPYYKGAGASEAGGQTKEGPLSKRYFQTSKIAQNRTKSPVPIVIDVFGVTAPYGNPYGS